MKSSLSLRLRTALFFALLLIFVPGSIAGALWFAEGKIAEAGSLADIGGILFLSGGGASVVILVVVALVGLLFDLNVAAPIQGLIRDVETVTHANPDHEINVAAGRHLGVLPETVREMAHKLNEARRETRRNIESAIAGMEEQKSRLEAILRDLHEGVVICTLSHQILLYNQQALKILQVSGELGLGRSLFSVMNRQPFLHALERLTNRLNEGRHHDHPQGLTAPFVCSTTDGRHTLEGQMSLIVDAKEKAQSYVITFDDVTDELVALGKRDSLLRRATEGLRQPVANLRAAAEVLSVHSDMSPEERSRFEEVIFTESKTLSENLHGLAEDYRDVIAGYWPMADVYSANLLNCVVRRLREEEDLSAVMTGIPCWLHADSHSLVELLDYLIHRVQESTGVDTFDLEAEAGDRNAYLMVVWEGPAIHNAELEEWLKRPLEQALGGLAARDVLEHHKTEIWSELHRDGFSRLRLPLPPAKVPPSRKKNEDGSVAPRPEFYDFGLLRGGTDGKIASLGKRRLKDLTFVAFDTETTGLQPSAGDEIISIAGVRVVNGRILTGESFSQLVNPRKEIPPKSIKFHGITDEMVQDRPPIEVVLPQFREFIGDAVLVAHNAAFDMKFLKLKEAESDVEFDMPVLDTLLLSVFLHDHTYQHTLDACSERFGIDIQGRHTALGDSLVTAGVFLRMIELLEAKNITTLEEAIDASNRIVEVRAQQAKF